MDGKEFFSISCPNQYGMIVYRAAVAELVPGEADRNGCETLIVLRSIFRHTCQSDSERGDYDFQNF